MAASAGSIKSKVGRKPRFMRVCTLTKAEQERYKQIAGTDPATDFQRMISAQIRAAKAKRGMLEAAKSGYDFGPTQDDIERMVESYENVD